MFIAKWCAAQVTCHWLRAFGVCRVVDVMLQRKQQRIDRLVEGDPDGGQSAELSPTELLALLLAESANGGRPKPAQPVQPVIAAAALPPPQTSPPQKAATAVAQSLFERCAQRLAGGAVPLDAAGIDALLASSSDDDTDPDDSDDDSALGLGRLSMAEHPTAAVRLPAAGRAVGACLERWECGFCGGEHLSVMQHVAERWSSEGCPACEHTTMAR